MSGREEVIGTDEYRGGDTNDGIMSRSVGYLFNAIQTRRDQTKFALSASYLEIYNEGKQGNEARSADCRPRLTGKSS